VTEENEVWKLQASVYREDFDKERFEKEQIQSVREQERGQQTELHRENQLLREQVLYKNLVCCLQQDVPRVSPKMLGSLI
jgi:hypothetical protein